MATIYSYESLAHPDPIRLLTLHPGRPGSELHAHLARVPLSKTHIPVYEAVSYTWDSTGHPGHIRIGSSDQPMLTITKNLEAALLRLRNKYNPRDLWIDAICVNQQDLVERSQQVKRMADVYTLAVRVIAWLGEAADESDLALRTVQDVGTKIKVDWQEYRMSLVIETRSALEWFDITQPLGYDEKTVRAVYLLFSRSWFHRLWIWQEIWLGSSNSIVLCGTKSVLWEVFRSAMFLLYRKTLVLDTISFLEDYYLRRDHVYKLCDKATATSFLDIAEQTTGSQCSDPRDRVYALLSLVPERVSLDIEPDYTSTVGEVYEKLFMHHVSQTQLLNILSYCAPCDSQDIRATWIPDWSRASVTKSLQMLEAASRSSFEIINLEEGILQATGRGVSTVKSVYQGKILPQSTVQAVCSELRQIWSWYCVVRPDLDSTKKGVDRLEEFCRKMGTDIFSRRCQPVREDFPDLQLCLKELPALLKTSTVNAGSLSSDMRAYVDMTRYFLQGRSAYITTANQIGLAPRDISAGDQIVVFLGCESAIVLHQSDRQYDGSKCHRVVGEAYCHRFMHGEALLGPIPSTHRKVQCTDEDTGRDWIGFIDESTSALQDEDPRVGPLPKGWTVSRDQDNSNYTSYVDEATGEGFEARSYDPRLIADELRKHIELEQFVLV